MMTMKFGALLFWWLEQEAFNIIHDQLQMHMPLCSTEFLELECSGVR